LKPISCSFSIHLGEMKLRVLARLVLLIRRDSKSDWSEVAKYDLDQFVIRIGRAKECEIRLFFAEYVDVCRAVSRYHATLFYYPQESQDYFLMDGKPGESDLQNPNPESILSGLGVYLNLRANKLEPNEKYVLKDKDEFHLIYDRLKFVYIREAKSVTDKLIEDTFIPPEYLT